MGRYPGKHYKEAGTYIIPCLNLPEQAMSLKTLPLGERSPAIPAIDRPSPPRLDSGKDNRTPILHLRLFHATRAISHQRLENESAQGRTRNDTLLREPPSTVGT